MVFCCWKIDDDGKSEMREAKIMRRGILAGVGARDGRRTHGVFAY
jgi:hypothetical protein